MAMGALITTDESALALQYWNALHVCRHSAWPDARAMAYRALRKVAMEAAGPLRDLARREYQRYVGHDPIYAAPT